MDDKKLSQEALKAPIEGLHLQAGTLGEQLGSETQLLVFLRHLGWIFCQETVEELRSVVEQQKDFPPVCFVFPAELKEGREFFDEFWPEARAVSDPQGEIFRLLDVSKASLRQIFGPGVWVKALQAMKKGYRPGRTIGNPWLLPGIFLIENSLIRWKWRFKNIGDHPDFSSIGGYR